MVSVAALRGVAIKLLTINSSINLRLNVSWLLSNFFALLMPHQSLADEVEYDSSMLLEEVYDFARSEVILENNVNYPSFLVIFGIGFVLLLLVILIQHIIIISR